VQPQPSLPSKDSASAQFRRWRHLSAGIGIGRMPALNQVELHPRFQQKDLREYHRAAGIVTEAWSPLGRGSALRHVTIEQIAEKHGKTPAQVVLRWQIELGNIVIPKSATPARMRENLNLFDFQLDIEDMRSIALLDSQSGRIGQDPERFSGDDSTFVARVAAALRDPSKIRKRLQRLLPGIGLFE
jgi:diketogulonate reductase-like aldo/keto reductase